MSTLNKSLVGTYQTTSLAEKINQTISGVDLNWRGYSVKNKDNKLSYNVTSFVGGTEVFPEGDSTSEEYTFEKYDQYANFNRAIAWLASKHGDYVRESDVGSGILYALLGKNINEENLEDWANKIRDGFNNDFANDLNMIDLSLKANPKERKLYITMLVQDLTTGKVNSQTVSATYGSEVI